MADESNMADQIADTPFGQNTVAMTAFGTEQNVLPPVSQVESEPVLYSQKTTFTCSSGIKDDDIEMDQRTPDFEDDAEILDSVLHDLAATDDDIGDRPESFKVPEKQSKTSTTKWVSRKVRLDEEDQDEEEQDGVTVVSPPPAGHGYDFLSISKKHGRYGDKDKYFPDQDIQILNKQKLFTKFIAAIAPKPKLLPSRKENRDSTRRGLRFVDLISNVPLSKVWHRTTQILAMIVFIVNVIVAFYDIVRDFKYLYYKVPAFLLTLAENAILLLVWLILRSKKFQTQGERSVKHQQYIENIVHEILMYPLLAMAAFGFATEKMYQTPSDAFGWAQLILLIVDVIELLWTQIVRLKMTYNVFGDIDSVVHPKVSKKSGACGWSTAGWVLLRTYVTTMGSIMTFLVLIIMLIMQVHHDNFTSGDYRITWRSGLILLCFILLPLYSILVYILANAFWVMEILLRVNIRVGNDEGFHGELAKQYGPMVSDALSFSMRKVQSNKEKLNELKKTPLAKKIVYGAIEPVNAFLLVFWQLVVITAVTVFVSNNDDTVNIILQATFGFLLLLANWHVFIVAIVADVVVLALLVGTLCYPFCLAICCKDTHFVDPQNDLYEYF